MVHLFFSLATFAIAAASDGYVNHTLKKVFANESSRLTRRQSYMYPAPLRNYYYEYALELWLGSPPQLIVTTLDTGSSDLWVYKNSPEYAYNPHKSSTSQYLSNDFEIKYLDGSGATGDYWIDELTWGGATIPTRFAVANQYSEGTPYGIFGLGPPQGEATRDKYDNYPFALKNAGLIESAAFSLCLNAIDKADGSILFGAIDRSQYTGPMSVVPLIENDMFKVAVHLHGQWLKAVLDAGTTFSYIPDDLLAEIAASFGATYNLETGFYEIDELPQKDLIYTFGTVDIHVPPSELFFRNGSKFWLSILPYSEDQYTVLLGDSFLRSAYVVFDLEHLCIGIAQVNTSPGEPDVRAISPCGILL